MLSFNHTTTAADVDKDRSIRDECPKPEAGKSKDFSSVNSFAHHVHHGKKLSQKARGITIQSKSDLNKPEVKHMIQALPQDKASLQRLAKLCPSDAENLGPG